MKTGWFLVFGALVLISLAAGSWWYNREYNQPGTCCCTINVQDQKLKSSWQAEDTQSCVNACKQKVQEMRRAGKKIDEWNVSYTVKTAPVPMEHLLAGKRS